MLLLLELGNLYVYEVEFLVEHLVGLDVAEFHGVGYLLLVESLLLHVEVQQRHGIYAGEIEVPVGAFLGLLADGERGIKQGAVLEEFLIGILHLDNEFLAVLALTIHIEDGLACRGVVAEMLGVEILHVLDNLLAGEEAIEEIDQQVLVGSSAEYALETEVGKQADVSFFYSIHTTKHIFAAKIQLLYEISK